MEASWGATRRTCDGVVHCTMSQAPLTLVEFKTWPSDGSATDGTTSNSSFCGLMPVPSFAVRFFKDFQRFCPLLPDLVLQLDSGERVNVHRVLFYCCSAYCRQKLKAQQLPAEKDCWQARPGSTAGGQLHHYHSQSKLLSDCSVSAAVADVSVIRVPRVDYESLRAVVDFVYSGGLLDRVCLESLPKIRFAATLLGIDEMVTVCDSLFRVYQQGNRGITTDTTNGQLGGLSSPNMPDFSRPVVQSPPKRESASEPADALISRCKRSASTNVKAKQQQRLPSVASVLAEMGTDNRLRLLATEPRPELSPVKIKQEENVVSSPSYDRRNNDLVERKRSSPGDIVVPSPSPYFNHFVQLIAYSKEDLVISEKYIYSSRIAEFQPLLTAYNVLQYVDEPKQVAANGGSTYCEADKQQQHRESLILFSLSTEHQGVCHRHLPPNSNKTADLPPSQRTGDECLKIHLISNTSSESGDIMKCINKDTQRFALLCHLDFSDQTSLFECCQHVLSNFMRGLLPNCDDRRKSGVLVELALDSLYCLKKSCGFKSSFRREPLLSTSECYKALAEYSRSDKGELPLVLLSCSGVFHMEALPIDNDQRSVPPDR